MRSLATAVRVTSYAGDPASIRSALTVAARGADLHGGALVTLDERAAGLRLSRGGTDVTASIPHRLLFSTSSFATFLIYGGAPDGAPLDVDVSVTEATTPQVRDPLTGAVTKPSRVQMREGTRISLTVPVAAHPLVLDFNAGATDRITESTDVRKDTLPSVAEIVARYQQAQAAQDGALAHYIAHMRLEQHFHPSPAEPAWNIVTENRLFFERGVVEWEELSFALNGATWTANRPSFPLVQPEKVLSLPLDLRLGRDYTYRLDGVDTVMGRPAYVVRFEPVEDAAGALSRHRLDRSRALRAPEGAGGRVAFERHGGLERRNADLQPGRRPAGPAGLAARSIDQQADVSHRRTDRAGGTRSASDRRRAEPARLRVRAHGGAGEQPHHVSRHRSGTPVPGETRGDAGRQQRH